MKIVTFRLVGAVLVTGALAGAFFSISGLISVLRAQASVKEQVLIDTSLARRALQTTADGLRVVDAALSDARANLDLIQASTSNVAAALEATSPSLQSTTDLIGQDLPDVIIRTRRSLAAAENSARLVDDTLRLISAIPLIGGRYTPEIPLQTSIAQVSDSLRSLPDSFQEISRGLKEANANIDDIQATVAALGVEYDKIDGSLVRAQQVNLQYQKIVEELVPQMVRIETQMPGWVDTFFRAIVLLLIWLIFTQAAVLALGVDWITRRFD